MTERIRVGQQRPVRMRRIGARHMIVMPPQAAQVMSVDQLEQALRVAEQQQTQTEAQLARHRAYIGDLRNQIAAFNALPIERDGDDPDVPQPEQQQTQRPARVRGMPLDLGHVARVTPIGQGKPPEGATPVAAPEPERVAADD